VYAAAELPAAQVLFTPELILSEEYSDNIFLTHENEVDDFITSAGVNLRTQIVGRTAGLELNYMPTFNSFADHSDLDYWRHAARVSAWNDFSRYTRFEASDDYLETENPLDETAPVVVGGPVEGPVVDPDFYRRGRNRYRTNVAQARLIHQFGANDRVYVGVLHSLLKEIDTTPGVPVDDYTNLQPLLGLSYWFTQRWGLEMEGYYSDRNYVRTIDGQNNDREEYNGSLRLLHSLSRTLSAFVEYRHTELHYEEESGANRDFKIFYPSAGIRYQFQKTAHILIGAGYYIQDVEDQDRNKGWVANSEIYKRWAFRSSFIDLIGASGYEIQDTGTADLGLAIYYDARVVVGHNFTSRLFADAQIRYRYNQYPDEVPEREDHILLAGAGLRYKVLQWLQFGLTYNYRDFNSDILTDEYTENSVIFSITMSPAAPYRWN